MGALFLQLGRPIHMSLGGVVQPGQRRIILVSNLDLNVLSSSQTLGPRDTQRDWKQVGRIFMLNWIQTLDYEHVSFRCKRCHVYGNLFHEFPLNEPKKVTREVKNKDMIS